MLLSQVITNCIREYYASLYNLPLDTEPSLWDSRLQAVQQYLAQSGLLVLSAEVVDSLECDITPDEFLLALKDMPSGKARGPDGFPKLYYTSFPNQLSAHFLAAFNVIPQTTDTLRAHIAMIPKEGKDPSVCPSYRPISLLNLDLKIFTKILAMRVLPSISDIVHLDQVGFTPIRGMRDKTSRVLSLIHYACASSSPTLLVSTDTEKAFDRISWDFISQNLRHVGLGPKMRRWTNSLYSTPTAAVKTNEAISQDFTLSNGTQQGCPLSPLTFILTLEPLLINIRNNQHIRGLMVNSTTRKIATYTNDLLFIVTDPESTIPHSLPAPSASEILDPCKLQN